MKKSKKILSVIAGLMAMAMTLTACGGSSSSGADSSSENTGDGATKDVLVVSSYTDSKNYDPYAFDSRQSQRVTNQVFERLVDHNEAGDEYIPKLAESWDEDENGITFHIRKGVKFHEGQELTSEDVVFSLLTAKEYPTANGGWDWIDWDNIVAQDDYTVFVPYKYPCYLTLAQFAASNIMIVCKETWDQYGEEVSQHINGTGPFMIGDWVMGDHLNLDRFDGYWGAAPKLSQIVMRFIPEASQAMIELETGGVDIVLDPPAIDIQRIRDSEDFKTVEGGPTVLDFLHMNTENEFFKDVKIRQAVAYAISAEDILQAVYQGIGEISYSCIAPGIVGYTNEFEGDKWPYGSAANIEKAKALLAEAGYPNGFDVVMDVDDNPNRIAASEVFRNNLEKVGIRVTIQSQDYATFWDKLVSGKGAIFMNGVNANSYEPDRAMYLRWHSVNAYPGGSNYSRYKNADFDKLMDKARATQDLNERNKIYRDAQALWVEQVPAIPYYVRQHVYAAVPNLEGVQPYGEACILSSAYFS